MPRKPIVSTRSNASADARRDFDDFDVDEELARFRAACRARDWRMAAELASNLDEHLARGGSLPVGWLGPLCMQESSDLRTRHRETAARAAKMDAMQRHRALTYAVVRPARRRARGAR